MQCEKNLSSKFLRNIPFLEDGTLCIMYYVTWSKQSLSKNASKTCTPHKNMHWSELPKMFIQSPALHWRRHCTADKHCLKTAWNKERVTQSNTVSCRFVSSLISTQYSFAVNFFACLFILPHSFSCRYVQRSRNGFSYSVQPFILTCVVRQKIQCLDGWPTVKLMSIILSVVTLCCHVLCHDYSNIIPTRWRFISL